jgi:hypothetical protein
LFVLHVADESSPRIREELRSLSPDPNAAVLNSSFYCRLFYADFDGDPDAVETGFLQSRYLVKVSPAASLSVPYLPLHRAIRPYSLHRRRPSKMRIPPLRRRLRPPRNPPVDLSPTS